MSEVRGLDCFHLPVRVWRDLLLFEGDAIFGELGDLFGIRPKGELRILSIFFAFLRCVDFGRL